MFHVFYSASHTISSKSELANPLSTPRMTSHLGKFQVNDHCRKFFPFSRPQSPKMGFRDNPHPSLPPDNIILPDGTWKNFELFPLYIAPRTMGHGTGVGLIRTRALLELCCCKRENQLALMRFLMMTVRSVLVGRRRGFIRRKGIAVLASLSNFSNPAVLL